MTSEATATESRLSGLTLLRTIVGCHIGALIHDSGEGVQIVDLGIGVASQDAVAAQALPDPNVATDYPPRGWVWRARYLTYGFTAGAEDIFTNRVDKDIRARRRLDNGDAYIIVNNSAEQGPVAHTIGVTGLIRQLWLIT